MNKSIKTLRKKMGFTQKELAKEMNVTQATVALWENNKSFPSTNKLIKLANVLNCSVDELLKKVV